MTVVTSGNLTVDGPCGGARQERQRQTTGLSRKEEESARFKALVSLASRQKRLFAVGAEVKSLPEACNFRSVSHIPRLGHKLVGGP